MFAEQVLVLSRVAKTYRAGVTGCAATIEVLRGLSLRLRAGELVIVEGGRGSGKTTLLLCAAGMLRPDEGDVRWPTLAPRPGRAPAGIAYASNRAPAYGFLTVRESLAYAATVCELSAPRSARGASELLELTGLGDCADSRQILLPDPERALLLVAMALVASPRLLLVDDLVGGREAAGRAAVARCLARVAASGIAVLWAATSIRPVAGGTSAYVLADGRLRRARPHGAHPHSRARLEAVDGDRMPTPTRKEPIPVQAARSVAER